MPKITTSGGPSFGVLPQEFDQHRFFNNGEKEDAEPEDTDETEGTDDLSRGNSSSASETDSEKTPGRQPKTDETPKPAPTTGSPSSPPRTAGSSVRRTGGGPGKSRR